MCVCVCVCVCVPFVKYADVTHMYFVIPKKKKIKEKKKGTVLLIHVTIMPVSARITRQKSTLRCGGRGEASPSCWYHH